MLIINICANVILPTGLIPISVHKDHLPKFIPIFFF